MKHEIEVNNIEQAQAMKIVSLLDGKLECMDAKITSKLSYARQQALVNMAAPATTMTANHHGVLRLFGGYWHQHRMLFSALVLSVILMAFFTLQNMNDQELNEQGDAYLLGAELPPEAYLNEGFDTWLSENSQQQ